jgi:large subunit ribosomal protein L32e
MASTKWKPEVVFMSIKKRTHPKFLRPNYGRSSRSRIKLAWRRPRGIDNKKRLKIKYMGASPSIGYRQPRAIRYFHPKGLPEVLVQAPGDLLGLKDVVIRIAGGVGRQKREAIEKLASSMGLHVLFVKKYPEKQKRVEKKDRKKQAAKEEKKAADGKSPDEQPKKESAGSPTVQTSDKPSSQAAATKGGAQSQQASRVSQPQQAGQHRHNEKNI